MDSPDKEKKMPNNEYDLPDYREDLLEEFRKIVERRLKTLNTIDLSVTNISDNNKRFIYVNWDNLMDAKDRRNEAVRSLINDYLYISQKRKPHYNFFSIDFSNSKSKLKNIRERLKQMTLEDVEETIRYFSVIPLRERLIAHIDDWQENQRADGNKNKAEFKFNFKRSLMLKYDFLQQRDPEGISRILSEEIPDNNVPLKELFDSLRKAVDSPNNIISKLSLQVEDLKRSKRIRISSGLEVATNSSSNEFVAHDRIKRNL
jgi:hypothetical protein